MPLSSSLDLDAVGGFESSTKGVVNQPFFLFDIHNYPSDNLHPSDRRLIHFLSRPSDYLYLHPNVASQQPSSPAAQHRVPAIISNASQCRLPASTCTPKSGQPAVSSIPYHVPVIVAIYIVSHLPSALQRPHLLSHPINYLHPNYSRSFHLASHDSKEWTTVHPLHP